MIFTACKKKNDEGVIEPDKRGHHGKSGRQLPPELKAGIKRHIESSSVVDSHYCRCLLYTSRCV